MNIQLLDGISIFDIFLEHEKDTSEFKWDRLEAGEYIEKRGIRLKGPLKERSHDTIPKLNKYFFVLTKSSLYKCNSEQELEPIAVLRFWNPRLEIVKEPESQKYGFRMTAKGQKYEFFTETKDEMLRWFTKIKKYSILMHLAHEYNISLLLGKGNYAKVHLAKNISTSKQYAIKSIEKAKMAESSRNMRSIITEIELLRLLIHPHVIRLYEVYESNQYIHLVLQYLKGGELFNRIENKGNYTEKDASSFIHQLLDTIGFCHSKGVIHRDLKPENIILAEEESDAGFKIVDFGLATCIEEGKMQTLKCGSPGYVAPEVLHSEGYDTKADIFSIGMITYILLTGVSPFAAENCTELLAKNKECVISYPTTYWKNISFEAKDLVKQLLDRNPEYRISAKKALEHPWFKNANEKKSLSAVVATLRQHNIKAYGEEGRVPPKPSGNLSPIEKNNSLLTMTPILRGRQLPATQKGVPIPQSPLIVSRMTENANKKSAQLDLKNPQINIYDSKVTYSPLNTANHRLTFKETVMLQKKARSMKILQDISPKIEEEEKEREPKCKKKSEKFAENLRLNLEGAEPIKVKKGWKKKRLRKISQSSGSDLSELEERDPEASPPVNQSKFDGASAHIFGRKNSFRTQILISTVEEEEDKNSEFPGNPARISPDSFRPGIDEDRQIPVVMQGSATRNTLQSPTHQVPFRKLSGKVKPEFRKAEEWANENKRKERRYSELLSSNIIKLIKMESKEKISGKKKGHTKQNSSFYEETKNIIQTEEVYGVMDRDGSFTFRQEDSSSNSSSSSYEDFETPEAKFQPHFFHMDSTESEGSFREKMDQIRGSITEETFKLF